MTESSGEAIEGKLGVLMVGLGAVSTTFIAGVMLIRQGLGRPIGALSQLGDVAKLAPLDVLEFAAWDICEDDAYRAGVHAGVLRPEHLAPIADALRAIKPMPGVFFPEFLKRLRGEHIKKAPQRKELVQLLREDIRRFKQERGLSRMVALFCASTEVHQELGVLHSSRAAFERALDENDAHISPTLLYAYACLQEGVPFANCTPNLAVDIPAFADASVPVAGKDLKTGQTLMKTIVAPGLSARKLGVRGWYSTNILGNQDGEVLQDSGSFRTKELSKLGVLESILTDERLYGDMHHQVRIDYFPPRGDEKQSWDNIDLFGWLDYPMQLKLDFLCKDSILAAPLLLDLALFLDLAARSGLSGPQDWLSFYFKSTAESDLFVQHAKLLAQLKKF